MSTDQTPSERQPRPVRGVPTPIGLTLISAVVVGALVLGLFALGRGNRLSTQPKLMLYCAAGMRPAADKIVEQYERQYQVEVQVQYGGSNTLLSQIEAGKVGDLFLCADEVYARQARQRKLAQEIIPVATQRPVIAVRQGNPHGIYSVEDLLRPGLRVAMANPDQAAIGRLVRQCLQASGHWAKLDERVTQGGVYKPTVTDLANDLKLGSVDAAIVWDATVRQYPELEAVHVPALDEGMAKVVLCVLSSSTNPTAALHFARYASASDRGSPLFASVGCEPVEGDAWVESPELTFFAGSVNRRALEQTIKDFERREGAVVNTVYNGCGILTAQMRTIREGSSGGFPDAYMACDVYYLENVKQWFQEAVNVSETEIVMVVQKGNPKNIRKLADLLRPGLRIVVGQPEQCTIGALTRRMLEKENLVEKVMANVVSQTATSAMLVPAVTTGSADVALAYATDAKAEAGRIDALPIDSPYTKAIQPFAIARSSSKKNLARRLFQAIADSGGHFVAAGFRFTLDPPRDASGDPSRPSPSLTNAKETP